MVLAAVDATSALPVVAALCVAGAVVAASVIAVVAVAKNRETDELVRRQTITSLRC